MYLKTKIIGKYIIVIKCIISVLVHILSKAQNIILGENHFWKSMYNVQI